ncbi:MAG: CPBP family intramembrane metalloprotease [Chlamydiae bacterium]|nr:CPBP family intramembrane metalloprotease [Chlamydiota bacterium]MBI3277051.1 CPBP family intramembrane metalloprotease [Chlamydiota bacterium]
MFALFELLTLISRGIENTVWIVALHIITIFFYLISGMLISRRLNQPSLPFIIYFTRPKKHPLPFGFYKIFRVIGVYALTVCLLTFFLFQWTHPQVASFLRDSLTSLNASKIHVELSSILIFTTVAFYEEIVFRLFIQGFVRFIFKKYTWNGVVAILFSSLLFSLGHFGILETWWVKFVQTFVIGIILGKLMKKYGMEISFAVHTILNIFALYTAPLLLQS